MLIKISASTLSEKRMARFYKIMSKLAACKSFPGELSQTFFTLIKITHKTWITERNRIKPINSLNLGCEKLSFAGSESSVVRTRVQFWPDLTLFHSEEKSSWLDILVKTSLKTTMKIELQSVFLMQIKPLY